MSRRGFDTSLSSNQKTKPNRKNSATIPTPDPEHAISHVPTHTSSERAALDLKKNGQNVKSNEEGASPAEVDDDVCFICAEPITFWSVGVCGHRTCHVCAVRLRTFYKKTDCTFCKTPLPSLLFSRSPSAPFPTEHHITPSPPSQIAEAQAKIESLPKGAKWDAGITHPGTLDIGAFPYGDDILGVVFEDEDMMDATLLLLRFNCPYTDCPYQGTNWQSLEKHTLATHGLMICSLCRSTLSRFAHEQGLYPPHLIGLHDPSKLKRGQRPPRPRGNEVEMVKGWDAPHPMCEFCHLGFFGPDELFKHMRADHEECFVCKDLGDRDVYFQNYDALAKHFNQDHFPCPQPICLEKKFIVFGTDMDLKAHMISEHSESMSARDRAQSRQINVDFSSSAPSDRRSQGSRGFTLAQPFDPSRGGPSRIREAPSHQQLDQPNLTPAQRQQQERQVNRDRQEENRRRKAFATGLTRPDDQSTRVTQQAEESGSGFATPSEREDVDEATATRHAELLSRVSMLVSDSSTKLTSFRSAVRSYKTNESAAKDMVDTIFHVFDRDLDTTTGIVREVASLFGGEGDGEKGRNVLEALNAFRVEQQEQFPSLGNVTPQGLGSNYAGITSGKILNAKRTTRSGGGGSGSRNVWSRVEAAAASHPVNRPTTTTGINGRYVPGSTARVPISSTSAFPSLSGPSTSSSSSSKAANSTPWAGGGGGGSSSKTPSALAGPQIRSVNFPVASSSKAKPLNNSAFPSLPSAGNKGLSADEKKALFSKPNARDESIRRITGTTTPPSGNGWGSAQNSLQSGLEGLSVDDSTNGSQSGGVGGTGGGGKKKGKSKQLLFSVSARPQGGPSHG
ncbi:hypothetical protein I302_107454 [Kwoniella bestiolae CBS 10118]|uniref:RING-type E3 ubiquitin transferase n=1 Tax=Kwoniella bestiolae CBS 10118 TaxID=1296100 RepID=A0A1B9FYJ0_9TREE|nr:cytoplasmic protein [Kwoniella bestiolae CBS 10118]OCF23821.1 cytoplasmic protein [Kwoniella bestiolae CBS 10118]